MKCRILKGKEMSALIQILVTDIIGRFSPEQIYCTITNKQGFNVYEVDSISEETTQCMVIER